MRILLKTYGCTLNQAESSEIKQALAGAFQFVDSVRAADVVIVNSCGVKDATENRIIDFLEAIPKSKRVIVCGCLTKINEARVRQAVPKALLLGPNAASEVAASLGVTPSKKTAKIEPRVVASIGIATGCLGACTYCGTKLARGNLKSKSVARVVSEVEAAVASGAREIRLTAVDCGCYGLDRGTDLPALLNEVAKIDGDFRVRVGMMNANHLKGLLPAFVSAFKSPKFFKFFHLPVQSGSNGVLRHMHRPYSIAEFKRVVLRLRKEFPDAVFATDVIVGYPTETQADFEKTLALLRELKFDVVNVSKFCRRSGTPAFKLKPLATEIVKKRSEAASKLARAIALKRNKRFVGRQLRGVLLVERKADGSTAGWAFNYKQVSLSGGGLKLGESVDVKVVGAGQNHLKARLKT
ncbi:MAG: tRNA (N(6)-L-threonylcarbamoyladenosine(37)-C(2))-methylthiotransferase [Candidatus Micrarchaeota archaeon]